MTVVILCALLVPISAVRVQDGHQMLPRLFSRTSSRLLTLGQRRMSSGTGQSKEAFQEFLLDFTTYSKETGRQILRNAAKGPNTRAYEGVMKSYRPSADKVAQMLAGYGKGPQGRMVTNSIRQSMTSNGNVMRSFTGRGFAEQLARAGKPSQADSLLTKIQARVPMIEAGIPVANVWKTPIPQHLKHVVQDAVQAAFKAGHYGTGAAAEKILAESAKVIAKGAGLFIGVGLGVGGGMSDVMDDSDHNGMELEDDQDAKLEEAMATLSEEPSVEASKDAAKVLDLPQQEVVASTLRYFMGQAWEAGVFQPSEVEEESSTWSYLDELHESMKSMSDEDLEASKEQINAILKNAQSLVETRQGLDSMVEADQEIEDFSHVALETEDMSKMEELE